MNSTNRAVDWTHARVPMDLAPRIVRQRFPRGLLQNLGLHHPRPRGRHGNGILAPTCSRLGFRRAPRLGSGLTNQSQKMTVAAMQMAEKKVWAHRS